jgi:phage tail sheath protein FI
MAFLVSPGVQVKEIDLTNVIPATSASIGAIAGSFQWGPADTMITVGSEKQLVQIFGQPNDDTYSSVLTAAQFLSYGNSLRVVRSVGSSALNAASGGAGILLKNADAVEAYTGAINFAAKYPGVIGNSIGIEICVDSVGFTNWGYKGSFNSAPGTSAGAAAVGGSNDEIHVVILDYTGAITGTVDSVLETYEYVSQGSDAKSADGTSNYWVDVINKQSAWVNVLNSPTEISTSGSALAGVTFDTLIEGQADNLFSTDLVGGVDDNTLTAGELIAGYDMFADAETVEVSLIMNGDVKAGADATTVANHIIALAESRKDCVAFVSPPIAATVNNTTPVTDIKTWRDALTSSSYAFADSSALYVYDKYNDKYRWLAASGSMAGLSANADMVADAWFSPAGFTRGNLRNVTKLAFNPKQVDRDDLYKVGINPIVAFPGAGTLLYGDKTLQYKASAFDRINVRRLFITLEKAISKASKASLFEFNDEFTRAQFRNMTEPFLRDIKGRRGITDFKVVCDDTNNTGNVIDTNRFVADIYIKPARSINFITLNFIATRTGVEFSEIAGGN